MTDITYLGHRLDGGHGQGNRQDTAYHHQDSAAKGLSEKATNTSQHGPCDQQTWQPLELRQSRGNVDADVLVQNGEFLEVASQGIGVNRDVQRFLVTVLRSLKPHLPER